MKTLKTVINYIVIFNLSFLPALQSLAEAPTYSMTPFEAPQPTNGMSIKGEFNYYKSLGIDGIPTNVTQTQIRESIRQGFPEILETKNIKNYDELMKSAEGRAKLTRQLTQALDLLSQASGKNLIANYLEAYKADSANLKEWNKSQNNGRWSTQVLSEYATVRSLFTVVKSHLNADYIVKAKHIFNEAIETLKSPKVRFNYDLRNGYRTFQASENLFNNVTRAGSRLHVKVKDPETGRKVNVKLDLPTHDQLMKFKVSDLAKDVMSGTFKYSALSGAVLTLLHGLSYFKLMADYSNNPRVVEDSFDENVNWLYFTSIATFFLGARLADWSLFQRNLNYARQLVTEKKIFANKPLEAKKARITSMANLSYWGLGTGLLASMAVLHGGEHLLSCLPLFNERPINERPMSKKQKDELTKMCDQAWLDYVLAYKNQFFLMWAALAGAKTLMTLGATTGAAGYRTLKGIAHSSDLKTYRQHLNDIKTQRAQYLEVAGRGTKINSVRAVLMLGLRGGLQLTVTVALVYGILWTYEKITTAYTTHKPVTTKHDKLQASLLELQNKAWSLDPNQCDENKDNCGAQKYLNDFDEYQKSLNQWRVYNFRSVSEAMENWMDYYQKAMNHYKAAKLFYKDIILQIAERKRMNPEYKPVVTTKEGFTYSNYLQYSKEALPLFRSSPFFGVKANSPVLPIQVPIKPEWQEYTRSFSTDLLEKNNTTFFNTLKEQTKILQGEFNTHKSKLGKFDTEAFQKIINLLNNSSNERIFEGYMYLISKAQAEADVCQSGTYGKTETDFDKLFVGNLAHMCVAYKAYLRLSRTKLWGEKQFPFQAGYQKSSKDLLRGAKPLPPGNEYLINYDTKFSLSEIDAGWYEEDLLGRRLRSMSEFMLLSAVCGPDAKDSFSDPWWKIGFSPKFTPPKLPLKTKFDICQWYIHKGYRTPETLWYYIPNDKEGKIYAGIIDFLYQELNESMLSEKSFDNWWDLNVRPAMEQSIITSNEKFHKDIVLKKLPKALQREDSSSNFWKYIFAGNPQELGYIPSITSEIGFYFNEVFKPMVDTFNVSFRNYEDENTRPSSFDKYKHFNKLRDDFYSQLQKLSNYRGLELEELRKIQLDTTLSLNKLRVYFDAVKFGRTIEDLMYLIQEEVENLETKLGKSDEELAKEVENFNSDTRKEIEKMIADKKQLYSKLEAGIAKKNNPVLSFEYFQELDLETKKPIINENTGQPLEFSEQQRIPSLVFNQIELVVWNLSNLLMAVTHIDQLEKQL